MTAKAFVSGPLAWMVAGCLASCGIAIALIGSSLAREIAFGMAGPLVSAVGSWVILERTHATAPERLTNVMIAAFGVKMVLFGVYVVAMLKGLSLEPLPFVLSFATYYVTLHMIEAGMLKRMTDSQPTN